jgi:hypothetical protein
MWLRLLVPLTLLWPILALAAEGTSLRRYKATPARELLALLFAIVVYFVLWVILDRLIEGMTGIVAAGIVAATALSLLSVPLLLFVGYKIFGVKPGAAGAEHESTRG